MLNLNKNTRLFFFQFIFQRNYSTDFELDEFIKQNIKKRPFNKKKLISLNDSFNSNLEKIKGLIDSKIIEKTKRTAGNVSMYAVFFSVLAKVSFIKKADNLYYPLF